MQACGLRFRAKLAARDLLLLAYGMTGIAIVIVPPCAAFITVPCLFSFSLSTHRT